MMALSDPGDIWAHKFVTCVFPLADVEAHESKASTQIQIKELSTQPKNTENLYTIDALA